MLECNIAKLHACQHNQIACWHTCSFFTSSVIIYFSISWAEICHHNNVVYYLLMFIYLRMKPLLVVWSWERLRSTVNKVHLLEIKGQSTFQDYMVSVTRLWKVMSVWRRKGKKWLHWSSNKNQSFQVHRASAFSSSWTGDKSEVLDIDNPDPEKFPEFYKATRYEGQLEPGDILFIPGTL